MATMNAIILNTTVAAEQNTSMNNRALVDLAEYPENLSHRGKHVLLIEMKSSLHVNMISAIVLLSDDVAVSFIILAWVAMECDASIRDDEY